MSFTRTRSKKPLLRCCVSGNCRVSGGCCECPSQVLVNAKRRPYLTGTRGKRKRTRTRSVCDPLKMSNASESADHVSLEMANSSLGQRSTPNHVSLEMLSQGQAKMNSDEVGLRSTLTAPDAFHSLSKLCNAYHLSKSPSKYPQ